MKLVELQAKYPAFVYQTYGYVLKDGDLVVSFAFKMAPDIEFRPQLVFKNVDSDRIKKMGEPALANLVFHLGLCEIPTYWKAACSPTITIEAGYLDKVQVKFWQGLFFNGMGQFYYENKLPFLTPKFKIKHAKPDSASVFKQKLSDRFLVPLGGGKDSLVSYELLRQAGKRISTLAVEPNLALKNVAGFIGAPNIEISRKIDYKIINLNKQGFFNGHTPFSSVLAFITTAAALIYDFKYIAISQERSSNEGNVKYLGRSVNHQYSKTYDFEKSFGKYIKKHLSSEVEFFSLLRPFYELQIAKIFSNYPKYFPVFLSCNKPFTLAARETGAGGWCGNCPKCLFTFTALYSFIGEKTIDIFRNNLFEQKELLPIMLDLVGAGTCKPFECVGTFEEARAAFYLSLQKTTTRPYLLSYFEENILPKYPKLPAQARALLKSWNGKNNVPAGLQPSLKRSVQG